MPFASRKRVKVLPVNWTPWSELKISGVALDRALCNASTQKTSSRVLETSQDRTYLENQSMMATRYRKPRRIGM